VPQDAIGMVVFAHGSGSSRFSPRNRQVRAGMHVLGTVELLAGSEGHAVGAACSGRLVPCSAHAYIHQPGLQIGAHHVLVAVCPMLPHHQVASTLQDAGVGTLLLDLLTPGEADDRCVGPSAVDRYVGRGPGVALYGNLVRVWQGVVELRPHHRRICWASVQRGCAETSWTHTCLLLHRGGAKESHVGRLLMGCRYVTVCQRRQ
jgi:hypothetical protein